MKINADERGFHTVEEIADDLFATFAEWQDEKRAEALNSVTSYINDFYAEYALDASEEEQVALLVVAMCADYDSIDYKPLSGKYRASEIERVAAIAKTAKDSDPVYTGMDIDEFFDDFVAAVGDTDITRFDLREIYHEAKGKYIQLADGTLAYKNVCLDRAYAIWGNIIADSIGVDSEHEYIRVCSAVYSLALNEELDWGQA